LGMNTAHDVVEHPEQFSVQAAASEEPVAAIAFRANRPEFIRLPKPGARCPWTGLTRSSINELILGPSPPVKSVVLARKGASRGVRIIPLKELISHLNGLMAQQQENGKGEGDE